MQDKKNVVLIIDDDVDFMQAVSLVLQSAGLLTVTAASAEEGLSFYKKEKPDLIIVDLIMEEIDSGIKFVKELKLLGSKTPVYLLSGTGDEMMENVDYSELGFAGVFQKPIDNKRLLSVISTKLKK